jgi:hypothetical protein
MAKTTRVFVIHITVQAVVGGLIVLGGIQNNHGRFDDIALLTFFGAAAFFILTSLSLTLVINKEYRSALRYSTFISILLWLIAFLAVMVGV